MTEVLSRHNPFECIPRSLLTARFYCGSDSCHHHKPSMSVYSAMVPGANSECVARGIEPAPGASRTDSTTERRCERNRRRYA